MKYKEIGGSYQLTEDLVVQTAVQGYNIIDPLFSLHTDGLLLLRAGFTWDGATGAIDTPSILKASAIHDVFCDLINDGRLPKSIQKIADAELVRFIEEYWGWIRENGTPGQKLKEHLLRPFLAIRRWYIYRAVRLYQENKISSGKKVKEVH